jgi:hypothetical protein
VVVETFDRAGDAAVASARLLPAATAESDED